MLVISDKFIDVNGAGAPVVPEAGLAVTAYPILLPLFAKVGAAYYEVRSPAHRTAAISAVDASWSLTLPWPSESDPTTTEAWVVVMPDHTMWWGKVPEGVAGPLTIKQLKDAYGWGLVQQHRAQPVQAIMGPAGQTLPTLTGIDGAALVEHPVGSVSWQSQRSAPPVIDYDFYISPTGNGANTGTSAGSPWDIDTYFARKPLQHSGRLDVHFAAGTYTVTDNIRCTISSPVGAATLGECWIGGSPVDSGLNSRTIAVAGVSTLDTTGLSIKDNVGGLTVNLYGGMKLRFTSGPAAGDWYQIVSNTADTFRLMTFGNWTHTPVAGNSFVVEKNAVIITAPSEFTVTATSVVDKNDFNWYIQGISLALSSAGTIQFFGHVHALVDMMTMSLSGGSFYAIDGASLSGLGIGGYRPDIDSVSRLTTGLFVGSGAASSGFFLDRKTRLLGFLALVSTGVRCQNATLKTYGYWNQFGATILDEHTYFRNFFRGLIDQSPSDGLDVRNGTVVFTSATNMRIQNSAGAGIHGDGRVFVDVNGIDGTGNLGAGFWATTGAYILTGTCTVTNVLGVSDCKIDSNPAVPKSSLPLLGDGSGITSKTLSYIA